jgi:galactokinase
MPAWWNTLSAQAQAAFTARFGGDAAVLSCAPGRVELLGNHTDYNGGLVISAAIDRATAVVARRNETREARVFSVNLNELDTFSVDAIDQTDAGAWTRYLRGVCWALSEWCGPLASGFEAAIVGNVPLGAGLSSSASLQAAIGWCLIQLDLIPGKSRRDFETDHSDLLLMELARVLRRSENEFVGVGSGLLDQFSSLFGRSGHALFLDCDTLVHDRLSLGDPPPAIVVCDSRTSRRLADSMYDQRRAECERVAAAFTDQIPHRGEFRLSWIALEQLERAWPGLDPIARRRARHVLSENERVRSGIEALKSGDIAAFGRLMSASHVSSRDDFENSSPALNALIEAARSAPGFLGGKLTGAGWAGCTVNLVRSELAGEFARVVRSSYTEKTDTIPEIYICHAADGAFGVDLLQRAL